MLLNYFLNFSETERYIDVLIPVISILNSFSKQLFPKNSFFLYKRSIKKVSISAKVASKGVAEPFMKLN